MYDADCTPRKYMDLRLKPTHGVHSRPPPRIHYPLEPRVVDEPSTSAGGLDFLDLDTLGQLHHFITIQGAIPRPDDQSCASDILEDLGTSKMQVIRMTHLLGPRLDIGHVST
jgi:hypothetical protein